MSIETTYNIIFSLVGVLALYLFYTLLWQRYCLDAFRSNLFELRYELIDLVASKKINYTDASYIFLRDLINSTIKNGHRYKFIKFLVASVVLLKNERFNRFSQKQQKEWKQSLAVHDEEIRERLKEIKVDYHLIIVQYFLSASILFWLLLVLVTIPVLIAAVVTNVFSKLRKLIPRGFEYTDSISSYKLHEEVVLRHGISSNI